MKRRIKLALAGLAAAAASFFMAAPAMADYTGNCFNVPTGTITGNVTLDAGGFSNCNLPNNLTATGAISITASGFVSTQNITAGASSSGILITAGSGITTGALKNGTIELDSQGTIVVNSTVTATGDVLIGTHSINEPSQVFLQAAVSTTNGVVNLEATSSINGQGAVTATNGIGIEAPSIVFATDTVKTTGGDVSVYAPGSAGVIEIGEIIGTGTSVTLTSGGTVQQTAIVTTLGNVSVTGVGTVTTPGISTTKGFVEVTSSGGTVSSGPISTTGGGALQGDVYVASAGNLSVTSVATTLGGNVDLKAQTAGGNNLFTIGTASPLNGVGSTIRTTGSGGSQTSNSSAIYITNGAPGSTGGISVASATNVQAQLGSGARGGTVIYNAQNGVLDLPSGSYSEAGTGAIGGGQISLMANTVVLGGTVTLDASQSATAAPFNNQVNIAASSISYTSGLTLNASGNGTLGGPLAQASLLPQGGLVVSDNQTPGSLSISVAQASTISGGLSVTGGTGAPLSVMANGNNAEVQVAAYPISFSGGAVTLQSQGATNHNVSILNPGVLTGITGLTFGGNGAVTLDASGNTATGAGGGNVSVIVDKAILNAPSFVVNASATHATGPGGVVAINSSNLALNATSSATLTANGFGTGSGANGGSISLTSNGSAPITLGTASGDFSLSANATGTAANGGSISIITPGTNPVVIPNTLSLSVAGIGTGNGGMITIANAAAASGSANIDVNKVFSVSAGTGAGSGAFDGEITLNGVPTCKQIQYTGNPWPTAYWDCTGQNAAVIPIVPATAAGLVDPTTIQGALNTAHVQLYAMNSISDWNKFFAVNPQNTSMTDVGETLVDSANSFIASSVFVNQGNGSANPYPDAATAYQLGHAFDVAKGTFSGQTTFTNAESADFSSTGLLNTTPCTTVFAFNTALCTGASNSTILETQYFGGVEPSPAVLFQALFEHVQTGSITTVGYESVLNYLPTSVNAVTVEIGAGPMQTCVQYNTSVTYYPNVQYTQYCGTSGADAGIMHDIVADSPGYVLNELRRVGTAYYLFNNPDQYRTFAAANGLGVASYGPNDFGTTKVNAQGVPTNSAIFETNQAGLANPNIQYTTDLQVGNGFDYLGGFVANGGVQGPTNARFSDSTLFRTQADSDWTTLNAVAPCIASGHGIFNGHAASPVTITYICNGSFGAGGALAAGFSGTNENVLNQAWPDVYTDTSTGTRDYAKDFQIAFAVDNGYSDLVGTSPRYSAAYMQQSFQCSKALLSQVQTNEMLPTTVPSGCPAITQTSNCQKLWLGTGYFPDGNVFNCMVDDTKYTTPQIGLAAQIQGDIQNLGGNSATANPIQTSLGNYHANIYDFPDQTTFSTVFKAAGITLTTQNITGFNGVTFPYGPSQPNQVWFTIINSGSSAGTNHSKQSYITVHELGHTIDFNTGQPSASPPNQTGFDLAMQNDWLYLDYTNFSTNTKRLPCTTGGPFINVVDPLTGNQVCSGGALNPSEGYLSGKTNSQILQAINLTGEVTYLTTGKTIGIKNGVFVNPGWTEWIAQALAIEAAADVSGVTATNAPELDQVVANGYMGCTAGTGRTGTNGPLMQGYMYWVYHQQPIALPTFCTTNLPTGWTEHR